MTLGNRFKNFLITVSIVLAAILLTVTLIEIGIRIFAPQPKYYSPRYLVTADNDTGYILTPNFKGEMRTPENTTAIKINSNGERGKEYDRNAAVNILGLGDSFTFGTGVEVEETFLWKIEETLNKRKGATFRVINSGVPGYGTDQEYLYFMKRGVRYKPELVIVCFYINDVMESVIPHFTVVEGYLVPSAKMLSTLKDRKFTLTQRIFIAFNNLELNRFVINRLSTAPYFRKLFLEYVVKSKGREGNRLDLYQQKYKPEIEHAWQVTQEYLKKIAALAKKNGGRMLLVYIPERQQVYAEQWRRIIKQYDINEKDYDTLKPNQLLWSFCKKEGINFLDMTDEFRDAVKKGNDIYFTMDPHINKKGHSIAAELIYKEIIGKALVQLQ